jgi:hypothetical protein
MQDPQPLSAVNWVDAPTQPQILQRLHRLTVYGRWLVVLLSWLTVGSLSLWQLRFRIQLLMDSFTWVGVRYGLAYHQGAALGLFVCIGMTLAVLVWHSRNLLFGLPKEEQLRPNGFGSKARLIPYGVGFAANKIDASPAGTGKIRNSIRPRASRPNPSR